MKNISRRVFIKGMAVAAAATAASTVLAGCNVVPGTDEPAVVPGFKSETKTLTLDDDKVTITTTGFGYTAVGALQVKLTAVNEGDANISFDTSDLSKTREIYVSAYFDGKYSEKATLSFGKADGKYEIPADKTGVSNILKTQFNVTSALPEKWETLTVVFVLTNTKGDKNEVTFVLNK